MKKTRDKSPKVEITAQNNSIIDFLMKMKRREKQMKNVKVILWGLGAMGGGIGKMLAKKKGVDIVGGIDIGDKIGKNLYDVVPGIQQGDRPDVIVSLDRKSVV